jgi:hypothetical protein
MSADPAMRLEIPDPTPSPGPLSGVRKTPSPPPRQTSEDSGIEPDCCCCQPLEDDAAAAADAFGLVASMTAAAESESFLLCQPNWSPFLTHVRRTVGPLRKELESLLVRQRGHSSSSGQERLTDPDGELVVGLAGRLQRFCQDSLIAFPKSLATAGRSPRYQDSLKVAVENMVLQLLHTNHIWPLISSLYRELEQYSLHNRRYTHF